MPTAQEKIVIASAAKHPGPLGVALDCFVGFGSSQ
jgi:hypothetical protein